VDPPSARRLVSGGFLCGDLVGGGGVDIKGPNHRRSVEQVLYGFLHRVELFALVALGILPPEGFGLRLLPPHTVTRCESAQIGSPILSCGPP
jgi:hypothetical protein